MTIMTDKELIKRAKAIAKYPTTYLYGSYGNKLTTAHLNYKANQYPKYNTPARVAKQKLLITKGGYTAWDCVGLIKGILWGWEKDKDVKYRGNTKVPDLGANSMIKVCTNVSTNFKDIVPGAVVWMSGHIGIYIGNGLAIEATTRWKNEVQTTAVWNIGKKSGYNGRNWTSHARLPWVTYSAKDVTPVPEPGKDYILHTVEKGDTPWALAVKYLNNGNLYKEIMEFNNKAHNATIYAGRTLKIPLKLKPTPVPVPVLPDTDKETYVKHVVKRGDTPWGLAERYLGDGRKYKSIMSASGLRHDAPIYANNVLIIPMGTHYMHKVVRGDTPWMLALRYLGNGLRYPEIMEINGLKPNAHIKVGQELIIPR